MSEFDLARSAGRLVGKLSKDGRPEKPLVLLIVDDDELDRLAVRRALQKLGVGAEIAEAESVPAALGLLRDRLFDCVLLDYQLPGGDGLKVLDEVRKRGISTPIIVLTGQGDDEVAARIMKSGAADYMSKASLNPERLIQAIHSAMRLAQAEAQTRGAESQLRASEARFRILHETSPDAFMIFRAVRDESGEMVDAEWEYTNAAGEKMSGFPADALAGRRLTEVMPGSRELGLLDVYRQVVQTGEPQQLEIRYDREDYDLWVRITAARLGDGFAVGASDITAQRRAEEERESALAAQSRFYAAMSHELRTPINAILGYTDLLLMDAYGALSAPQRNSLERANRATKHLLELVNDVLDLSKLEAGKIELQMEPVSIADLIHDLFHTVQPLALERGTEFNFHVGGCSSLIQSDPRRIRQILLNLFSNAIKFGGSQPVEVRCDERPGEVLVEVVDRGPGIAPENQERVFEEFVQLSEEQARGTGLGLPISRRLAGLLGGKLEVESELGHGSLFRLVLPNEVPHAKDVNDANS